MVKHFSLLNTIIMGVVIFAIAVSSPAFYREYVVWRYLYPYRKFTFSPCSERVVTAERGKPAVIITDQRELREWIKKYRPPSELDNFDKPVRDVIQSCVGKCDQNKNDDFSDMSKGYIYYAEPWKGQQGYVVYVLFDRQGSVYKVVLGG